MEFDHDPELEAIRAALNALTPLEDEAKERVWAYIGKRLEIITSAPRAEMNDDDAEDVVIDTPQTANAAASRYEALGELFAAAQPKTNGQKALVVGYWLQVKGGLSDVSGQAVNGELKQLGHGVANITNALEELKNTKPALAIQLRKSGTSKQARKKYKITEAGIKAVEEMLRAEAVAYGR